MTSNNIRYVLCWVFIILTSLQVLLLYRDERWRIYLEMVMENESITSVPNINDINIGSLINNSLVLCERIGLSLAGILFWRPLIYLYMNGPTCFGYGFWRGQDYTQICTEMTSVPVQHWLQNRFQCHQLIFRSLESFVVSFQMIIALLIACGTIYWLWCNWFYTSMIDMMFDKLKQADKLKRLLSPHNSCVNSPRHTSNNWSNSFTKLELQK